jgi:5-methylthioadenosine/S-adenosylhomocysteine deaminase
MTIFQGINDDKEMMDWLKEDIWPREAKLKPEDIYIAAKFGISEMLKGGVVFCNDMYRNREVVMKVIDEMGIRGAISDPENYNGYPELLEKKKISFRFY